MYLTVLQICYTKMNQGTLCTAKLNEGFAMLIPKVLIHCIIRPLPQAFVSASGKFHASLNPTLCQVEVQQFVGIVSCKTRPCSLNHFY